MLFRDRGINRFQNSLYARILPKGFVSMCKKFVLGFFKYGQEFILIFIYTFKKFVVLGFVNTYENFALGVCQYLKEFCLKVCHYTGEFCPRVCENLTQDLSTYRTVLPLVLSIKIRILKFWKIMWIVVMNDDGNMHGMKWKHTHFEIIFWMDSCYSCMSVRVCFYKNFYFCNLCFLICFICLCFCMCKEHFICIFLFYFQFGWLFLGFM